VVVRVLVLMGGDSRYTLLVVIVLVRESGSGDAMRAVVLASMAN
jgi:hypothetical protein